ncbi:hypothetical protein MPH_13176 [Macrophomina phaseolina MS6]|uniref:Uncharacterized protein n=1 Tax=Macrophomina phaseolina (strain MS6) TaxID=1126212 RepID=K2R6C6_MACPH|nr:hypothetical protein MPH_13176 [Macrophomina phaseolina MS6]
MARTTRSRHKPSCRSCSKPRLDSPERHQAKGPRQAKPGETRRHLNRTRGYSDLSLYKVGGSSTTASLFPNPAAGLQIFSSFLTHSSRASLVDRAHSIFDKQAASLPTNITNHRKWPPLSLSPSSPLRPRPSSPPPSTRSRPPLPTWASGTRYVEDSKLTRIAIL